MDQPFQTDADRHTTGRQHLRWILNEYLSRSFPAHRDANRPPQLALRSEHATLLDGRRTMAYDWEMLSAQEAREGNDGEDRQEHLESTSGAAQDVVSEGVVSSDYELLSRPPTPIEEYFEPTMSPLIEARSASSSQIHMMSGIAAAHVFDEKIAWNKDARPPSRTCSNLEILFMFKDDLAPVMDRISASCPSLRDSQMQTMASRNWTTVLIRLKACFQFRNSPWVPTVNTFGFQTFQEPVEKSDEVL